MEETIEKIIEEIKTQIKSERERKWKELLEGMRIDYLISNSD